jgi:sugar phosphate isomerase/epimerase
MKRRRFLKTLGILSIPQARGWLRENAVTFAASGSSLLERFRLGAISDGFSQDFEEALKIMKGYGLSWVEIRNVWGIYNTEATPAQIQRLKALLEKYQFKVSVLDTALYKCVLPGTQSVAKEKDLYPYAGQMNLLHRAIERAHALGTDRLRGFTFWRVAQPQKISARITEELEKAAEIARKAGMRLVIENEGACNAGTGHELAGVLKKVGAPNVGANWDVGNGYWRGEISYPDGYDALDKKRIWHMHLKGAQCDAGLKECRETFPDQGQIDLVGQFRALARDRYQGTMSLECEFEAPGLTHLETTKRSMEGLVNVLKTTQV